MQGKVSLWEPFKILTFLSASRISNLKGHRSKTFSNTNISIHHTPMSLTHGVSQPWGKILWPNPTMDEWMDGGNTGFHTCGWKYAFFFLKYLIYIYMNVWNENDRRESLEGPLQRLLLSSVFSSSPHSNVSHLSRRSRRWSLLSRPTTKPKCSAAITSFRPWRYDNNISIIYIYILLVWLLFLLLPSSCSQCLSVCVCVCFSLPRTPLYFRGFNAHCRQ